MDSEDAGLVAAGDHKARQREFLAEVRRRHPRCRSDSRALLAEILTAPELSDRRHAASAFGVKRYRRGIGPLKRYVAELVKIVEASGDYWVGPPERSLLSELLIAVGCMDTRRSHNLLVRLLRKSSSHLVRADALESMAFEKVRFDPDLVLPFLSEHASTPEILSALYALEFHDYANQRPEDARERVASFLSHPYSMVRNFAVRVLMFRASNLDLILPLADDPEPHVQETVAEAVRFIEA